MRAYERLLKYARVYTTSDPNSGTHPSAEREFDLAHILVEDMKAIGIEDAFVDEHCYVYGTLPATLGCEDKPALGLIAHMDTAPDASGENVNPILHENYDGRDVTLPATGTVHGFSVHPGSAKDAMINASNVAMEFHQALPVMARPETTEGRQGFYHLCQMYGDVTEAKLGYILRDHDAGKLQFKKDNLLHIACYLNGKYGDGTVEVEIKDSYRNMIEKIKPHFHLVENARKAIEKAGLTPEEVPVRGGTDGAVLSWKGLPCPNLGTGGFNFHGVCECTTVERMDKAAEVLLNIVEIYSK